MMGVKERHFDPLPREISLEDLVPEDNFYRRLEATLDLSFVRELARPLYANGGRPSVDPVVFSVCSWSCSSRASVASGSSCALRPTV